jgi:hypothetical protein
MNCFYELFILFVKFKKHLFIRRKIEQETLAPTPNHAPTPPLPVTTMPLVKEAMKKFQYRKYKEVYQVNIDVIKFIIKNCDTFFTLLNETIEKEDPKDLKDKKIFIYVDKE